MDKLKQQAQTLIQAGDMQALIELLFSTLQTEQLDIELQYPIATALHNAKHYQPALQAYLAVLQLEPTHLAALLNGTIVASLAKNQAMTVSLLINFLNTFTKHKPATLNSILHYADSAWPKHLLSLQQLLNPEQAQQQKDSFFSLEVHLQYYLLNCLKRLLREVNADITEAMTPLLTTLNQYYCITHPNFNNAYTLYDCIRDCYWKSKTEFAEFAPFEKLVVAPYCQLIQNYAHTDKIKTPKLSQQAPYKICYLTYALSLFSANALGKILYSQWSGHQQSNNPNFTWYIYVIEDIDETMQQRLQQLNVNVRLFNAYENYDERFAAILKQAEIDKLDVAITETNRAMQTACFAKRIAPLQLYWFMGFPNWQVDNLDYFLLATRFKKIPASFNLDADKVIFQNQARSIEMLKHTVDKNQLAAYQAKLPKDKKIIGSYARLVKFSPPFLQAIKKILIQQKDCCCVIAGIGNAEHIEKFITAEGLQDRLILWHEFVSGQVMCELLDVFLCTFPIHSGTAGLEALAHDTPVVHMLEPNMGGRDALKGWRDEKLVADTDADYVNLCLRLLNEPEFYAECQQRCAEVLAPALDNLATAKELEGHLLQLLRS